MMLLIQHTTYDMTLRDARTRTSHYTDARRTDKVTVYMTAKG